MHFLAGSTVYGLAEAGGGLPSARYQYDGLLQVAEWGQQVIAASEDGGIVILGPNEHRHLISGVPERVECLIPTREDHADLLIGTEGAHLYRLREDGDPAQRIESFEQLPCRDQWRTPWGAPPSVRSLAQTSDGWVYADIHVGSIMRSYDNGTTWEPVTPTLNEDVHQVAVTTAAHDHVYANTARGVYISGDRGTTWQHRAADLQERYGRAIAVHPNNPSVILASVSNGPHGDDVHGQLYRSEDGGRTWQHVRNGFPESTRRNINTFHVAFAQDGTAWAAVGRDLFAGSRDGTEWSHYGEAPCEIRIITCGL